jgi:hypothetical protein
MSLSPIITYLYFHQARKRKMKFIAALLVLLGGATVVSAQGVSLIVSCVLCCMMCVDVCLIDEFMKESEKNHVIWIWMLCTCGCCNRVLVVHTVSTCIYMHLHVSTCIYMHNLISSNLIHPFHTIQYNTIQQHDHVEDPKFQEMNYLMTKEGSPCVGVNYNDMAQDEAWQACKAVSFNPSLYHFNTLPSNTHTTCT